MLIRLQPAYQSENEIMPNRIIRDGILSSESVCSLSWAEEVLYRRLMSVVDDYGRTEANLKLIRAKCYPLQIEKVSIRNLEDWMNALMASNLITVYENGGKKYMELTKFNQRDRGRESKFPPPPAANGRHPPQDSALSVSVSVSEDVSVFGINASGQMPPAPQKVKTSKFAARPESMEECVAFVTEKLKLTETDGVWLWDHWMTMDFRIKGQPMASWKHGASNWKAQRYFPSLKEVKR